MVRKLNNCSLQPQNNPEHQKRSRGPDSKRAVDKGVRQTFRERALGDRTYLLGRALAQLASVHVVAVLVVMIVATDPVLK